MTARKRKPAAIYRKPEKAPATPEALEAWAKSLAEPDPLGRMLTEWTRTLHELLEREGVSVESVVPLAEAEARWRRGLAGRSVEGGHVWYREADVAPVVLEAIDALAAIETIRRSEGDRRTLAAVDFGQALERLRATAAFAATIHTGQAVRKGGKVGAARAHGPRAEREAERDRWRARYAELRRKFPVDPKKTLLGMIEDETGETFRTLRRYIKQR